MTDVAANSGPTPRSGTGPLQHSEHAVADAFHMMEFFEELADYPADTILRVSGNFQIRLGQNQILVDGVALEDALRQGTLDASTVLMRSLLVYEAAVNAYLRQSAARSILTAFSTAVSDGADAGDALLDAYFDVALAYDVEAYVHNKSGLARDIREVGGFTEAALAKLGEGAEVPPDLEAQIAEHQAAMDLSLNTFMDAVADAQATGHYSVAYDTQQAFFQVTATIIETDYWRTRSQTRSQETAMAETMGAIARSKATLSGLSQAVSDFHAAR